MTMTTNEAIAKYNFISKVLLKSADGELSRDTKVKVMSMRIELSKIKKAFDEDAKAFADELLTEDFRNLAQKQDRTEDEQNEYITQEVKINEAYNMYTSKLGQKEVDVDASLTEEEYNEIMLVNVDNDVTINNQNIPAGDFLEIIYALFVNENENEN